MDDMIVRDHLGRPCKTTEAFDTYAESIDTARKLTQGDPRNVALRLSDGLLDVHERIWRVMDLLRACEHLLPGNTDCDQAAATLQATKEYVAKTSDMFGDTAAFGLVALERGGMWPVRQPSSPASSRTRAKDSGAQLAIVSSETLPQS